VRLFACAAQFYRLQTHFNTLKEQRFGPIRNQAGGAVTAPVRIGYEADFAPLTFREDGDACGFVIEILTLIFARIGRTAEYIPVPLPDQEKALAAGTIDAIAFKAVIPERAAAYDFSAPITVSGAAWFARDGIITDGCPSPGSRIATPGAGPLLAQLRSRYPDFDYPAVGTYAEALDAVIDGAADCAALNFHVGRYLAERDHPGIFSLPEAPFQTLDLAMATAKDKDASMMRDFDRALAELGKDGTLRAVERRWIS